MHVVAAWNYVHSSRFESISIQVWDDNISGIINLGKLNNTHRDF